MREHIFKTIIKYLRKHPSRLYGMLELQILLSVTAKAFGQKGKCILFAKAPLESYAHFTVSCMEEAADQERLYQVSYRLGRLIRRMVGFKDQKDLMELVFFLYQNIGITMEGQIPGEICVSECFFSRIYSARQCGLISAMDRGIITGICGGDSLEFTRRITEGCDHCKAFIAHTNVTEGKEDKMNRQKTAVVIGTGAGGATIAKELQGEYQVTMLEIGKEFKPFSFSVNKLAKFRKTGLFFDERLIRLLLPNMIIDKTKDMVLVRGFGKGGTTTLATGNAVRYDKELQALGINLDQEFEELYQELPITTDHQKRWTKTTKKMFSIFENMGLDPVVTPKFLCADRCIGCGHCAIGCPTGAKWDTRVWVDQAVEAGAGLVTGCKVTKLEIEDGKVTGVLGRKGLKKVSYHPDLVVLAAGGLGSPVILENSGIACQKSLFVDPVLCVAGPLPGIRQDRQILMPFISQQDGYILSPYMDYLSFFFDKRWRLPMRHMASIMIKLADEEKGSTDGKHVEKTMTAKDQRNMEKAIAQCREILKELGVPGEKQFLGTLNAGHPGGMLPLTAAESETLHHPSLPENLYVADATLFPKSMGNPPILTIMALAKRIAGVILDKK